MRKLVFGFILAAGSVQSDPLVIAALGDSLTQGYGLVPTDGFVPQLQSWLDAKGVDVQIINAGVSGDTTAGGLSRVDWTLTPEVDAMIVALGGNDLLRGLDPALSRSNIEGILKVAEAKGVEVLLVGMSAPSNYGPEYKASFDAIYPELSDTYGTLYLDSFFAGLGETSDLAAVQDFMQADGIHPNTLGVTRIVEGVGPKVLELIETVEPQS
jgi:acyl-CoA thioesterase-1